MWKDFFYFSLSERRAIYVLLVLIAVLIIAIIWTPTSGVQSVYDVAEADSLVLKLKQKEERKSFSKNERIQGTIPTPLAPFEPNLADSIELLRLGLPSYVVNNVIHYNKKVELVNKETGKVKGKIYAKAVSGSAAPCCCGSDRLR